MGFGIVEAGNYNPSRSLMNVHLTGIRACVFDAYGTLFDVNSAAELTQDALREKWQQLAEVWRAKQLQYTWLHSLTGRHVDFWQVTSEALDFALDTLKLPNGQLREQLMRLYLRLGAYPEVKKTLTRLKAGGLKCAILSNGSPTMLSACIENAGIADLLDAVLSVEEAKVYKPHPTVYQLVVDRLSLKASAICYLFVQWLGCVLCKNFRFPRNLV